MTRVIVDAALLSRLHNLNEPLELCDESGHVLARVAPVSGIASSKMTSGDKDTGDLSEYEPLEPQISEEEILRRLQSNEKTYSTAEVLAHLGNL